MEDNSSTYSITCKYCGKFLLWTAIVISAILSFQPLFWGEYDYIFTFLSPLGLALPLMMFYAYAKSYKAENKAIKLLVIAETIIAVCVFCLSCYLAYDNFGHLGELLERDEVQRMPRYYIWSSYGLALLSFCFNDRQANLKIIFLSISATIATIGFSFILPYLIAIVVAIILSILILMSLGNESGGDEIDSIVDELLFGRNSYPGKKNNVVPLPDSRKLSISGIILGIFISSGLVVINAEMVNRSKIRHAQEKYYQDSLAFVAEQLRIDSIEAVERAEQEAICRFYGDGQTFDVRGHVKSIGFFHNFDREGLVIYDEANSVTIYRNTKGQIVKIQCDDPYFSFVDRYQYNQDGSVLEKEEVISLEGKTKTRYTYDVDGYVSAITTENEIIGADGVNIENPKTFTIRQNVEVLERDACNNWTKRRITGEVVEFAWPSRIPHNDDGTVEIISSEYAGISNDGGGDSVFYVLKTINRIETREINYYK